MGVIADKIRRAIFGGEVRDSIADGIEVVEQLREDYDNQVINAGNSNAEIVDARGGQTKLKDRLDNFDEQLEYIERDKPNKDENGWANLNTFDEETRSKILGLSEGETNINAVLGEGNVLNRNLENNILTLNKFNEKIQKLFNVKYSPLSLTFIDGYYCGTNGNLIEATTEIDGVKAYSYTEISVNGGEKFRLSGVAIFGSCLYVMKDKNNAVIKAEPSTYLDTQKIYNGLEIEIPNNCTKIIINNYLKKAIIENVNKVEINLPKYLVNSLEENYDTLSLVYTLNKYYIKSSTGTDIPMNTTGDLYSCCLDKIKVLPGNKFIGSGVARYGALPFIIVDLMGNYIAQYPSEHDISKITTYDNISFIVPDNGAYLLVNSSPSNPTVVKRLNGYKVKEYVEKDKCDGKVYVFDGDSITYGAGVSDHTNGILPNKNMGWVYGFQQKHPKAICYGYAQSGWRIARKSTDSTSLLQHITEYPSNVDYFVLSGGYNDQAQNIPLGVISDKYYNCEFDEYTFTGALESYFRQLVQKYPDAKKLYILTPKRIYSDSSSTTRFNNYWQRIREVCDKWAIEFKDLSKVCGIVGTNETEIIDGVNVDDLMFADTLGTGHGDYCHPNERFYEKHLNDKVDSAIISL